MSRRPQRLVGSFRPRPRAFSPWLADLSRHRPRRGEERTLGAAKGQRHVAQLVAAHVGDLAERLLDLLAFDREIDLKGGSAADAVSITGTLEHPEVKSVPEEVAN